MSEGVNDGTSARQAKQRFYTHQARCVTARMRN
jgi:hypothetical protein